MSTLRDFTLSTPRPLPVIVLADVSGSMAVDGKIQALNLALSQMISAFSEEQDFRAQIQIAVVTFGGKGAQLHTPLSPCTAVQWIEMSATGKTPLGDALRIATDMIEDRNAIPSRAYRPTVVLVSDGRPTDQWEDSMGRFLISERSSKAVRLALAIGVDADQALLERFVANSDYRVFRADEARQIPQFFRWVTMSVTTRSRSSNPDAVPALAPTDLSLVDF
jgi:uncharacterized protein YegL